MEPNFLYTQILKYRKEAEEIREEMKRMRMDNINMQFKYDIALNLVGNNCSRYYINTLEDSSIVKSMVNFRFNEDIEILEYKVV